MTARSLLARALASVAVVGVAIAGPVTGAGAATNDGSTAAVGVTVDLGARPVVTIGQTPASGTGVSSPPIDGHVAASVDAAAPRGTATPVAGAARSAVRATGSASVVGPAHRV